MPLPKPKPKEKYKNFVKRFLKDSRAKRDFPDIKQRFAVMASTWRKYTKRTNPKGYNKKQLKNYLKYLKSEEDEYEEDRQNRMNEINDFWKTH